MNEFITANEVTGGTTDRGYFFETCPGCAGHIVLQDNGQGGAVEVCESCGPVSMFLVDAPKEILPPPVDPKDAGEAPMPVGLMVFTEPFQQVEDAAKVKKNVHRPNK